MDSFALTASNMNKKKTVREHPHILHDGVDHADLRESADKFKWAKLATSRRASGQIQLLSVIDEAMWAVDKIGDDEFDYAMPHKDIDDPIHELHLDGIDVLKVLNCSIGTEILA